MPARKSKPRANQDRKWIKGDGIAAYRDELLKTQKICPILQIPMDKPVLDHDHKTGKVRGVISNQANILLGKIENYLDHRVTSPVSDLHVVENILQYLEDSVARADELPFHPIGLSQVCRRFSVLKKQDQVDLLSELGLSPELIASCSNSRKRTNLYRKFLKG